MGSGHTKPARDVTFDSGSRAESTLRLFAAQLDATLRDVEGPVGDLSEAFVKLTLRVAELGQGPEGAGGELPRQVQSIGELVQQCIVALQFPDRMNQRIRHVETGLAQLAALLSDPGTRNEESAWGELDRAVRANYSMAEEHELADRLLSELPAAGHPDR